MTILQYAKKELAKLKDQPPKKRWEYIWEYYKIHLLVTLLVIVLLVQGIVTICTKKETVFTGILINTSISADSSSFMADLRDYLDVGKKEQVSFSTNIFMTDAPADKATAMQSILASITIQELDMVAGPAGAFEICAYNSGNLFADLRDYLEPSDLEKYADRLYYIDGSIIKKLNAPVGTEVDLSQLTYPDPLKPETMEEPIPVGIDVSDRSAFISAYFFPGNAYYLGMIRNTTRPETVLKFIEYLFS